MNRINYKHFKWLLSICLLLVSFQLRASEEELDVQEVVFSHIQDAYTWHITEWGDHEISIPLPVIVKSQENGWHVFLSSRLHEGENYQGFSIAQEGDNVSTIFHA